jgi:peroxiredoxin/outer membrane lipoprotein-sorting protein
MLNRLRRTASIGVLVAAASGMPRAAEAPDARKILDDVARTYRSLTSFHFAGTISVNMTRQGTHQSFEFPVVLAAVKPGRARTEMQNPAMGMVMVTDGKTLTSYSQQAHQYQRRPAPKLPAGADTAEAMAGPGSPLGRYFAITRSLKSARWLRTQTFDLGGRRLTCDVVAADYEHPPDTHAQYSPTTFWIDRARSVVVRESTHVHVDSTARGGAMDLAQTTTFSIARINERVPDSLFTFRPPADAREVTKFEDEEGDAPNLSRQKAEDFTLRDLAGKPVQLSSLKGKVVLLDFWATWCGPCRIEMPNIQKLHRELKARGLVVLGINEGEDAAKVRPFLKKYAYDFRILLDRQQTVGRLYKVTGIPTMFIIDRTGTISAHFVGLRDERTLREALAKAGVK